MNLRNKTKHMLLLGTLACSAMHCLAQSFPTKPIHIIVPYNAGGALDAAARTLANGLTKRYGQPVLVENKPGANTLIATRYVLSSKPDGYTLYLTATTPFSMLPALYKTPLGYDAKKDYTPVVVMAEVQSVLFANPNKKINTLTALVEQAKTNPGKLTFSSSGTAQPYTLATELLNSKLGIQLLQIPFQGAAPAIQAVVAGDVDIGLQDVGGTSAFIKAGRLVPLAVTSKKRLPSLPDVPTIAEAGFSGVDIPEVWIGIVGPAGMPVDIVKNLNEAITAQLSSPEMTAFLTTWSLGAIGGTSEQMDVRMKSDAEVWGLIIKKLGLQVE
jgi:tripartite-type tricarboxylate transporter receptor subunit TctC